MPNLAVYRTAEAWARAHQKRFERDYPGQYLLINAREFAYVVAPTFKEAVELYHEKYDPIPFAGWTMLGIQLK